MTRGKTKKTTIPLYALASKKADLNSIDPDTRNLYLMLGQVANDINILRKQMLFSANGVGSKVLPKSRASIAVQMVNMRLLAGRAHEAWILLNKRQNSLVIKGLYDRLPDEAKAAKVELGRYFGQENLINILRNRVAFHNEIGPVAAGYDSIADDEVLVDYMALQSGNNLYYSAEMAGFGAIAAIQNEADIFKAINAAFLEITKVAALIEDIVAGFMTIFYGEIRKIDRRAVLNSEFPLEHVPSMRTVSMPYFCRR